MKFVVTSIATVLDLINERHFKSTDAVGVSLFPDKSFAES